MTGQGSPRTSIAPLLRYSNFWMLWWCCLFWAVPAAFAHADPSDPLAIGLRIAWGGGAEGSERPWRGTIRLTQGSFTKITPLGLEADGPGSQWIEDGVIHVESPSSRAYDAIDVEATAPLDAVCHVVFEAARGAGEKAKEVDVPLKVLAPGTHSSPLDERGNRLFVSRSPGDQLHVRCTRDSLVFSPGESFGFEVEPRCLPVVDESPLRVRAQLWSVAGGQRMWAEERDAPAAGAGNVTFELKVPDGEGVYNLSIVAANTRLGERLGLPWNKPLAERQVQLVVVGPKTPPGPSNEANALTTRALEIDPTSTRWRERLAGVALLPALRKGPLGSGDAARWDHPKFGQMMQLGPSRNSEPSWEAYPLPLTSPGQPHVLELEYPSDVPQTMGISLLEPNAAGAVGPIGLDSGVYVSDEEAEETPRLVKHRLVFWPRTKAPLLLITNQRAGASAVYGKLRVLTAAHRSFASLSLGRGSVEQHALPRALASASPARRLLAAYFDRPLMTENFCAAQAVDPTSHTSLDDWTTFYQGGTRLVEYLHYAGMNGAMLTVLADGSTIYPSQLLAPTPRYDTGVFFSTGQDVVRKDVLELLFRLFDRDALQLVPAVQFAAPLAQLEPLRRSGEVGIELVGADGKRWLEKNSAREGLAPHYNPLDPRVQQAIEAVIDELVGRYAGHPSFGGLAVQLSAQGYTQLPPGDWGYDDVTIARFERETGVHVPGSGERRFAERAKFLGKSSGAGSAADDPHDIWLRWRATSLANFHRRLEKRVAASHKGAKLYLAGATMLDHPVLQRKLRPALPRQVRIEDVLLSIGIDPKAYVGRPSVVLMRPHRIAPAEALAIQGGHLEMNLASDADDVFASALGKAALFYHQPQKMNLPSFDSQRPFGTVHTLTWLVSELSPSAHRNRRRFVHAMAASDVPAMFDGGWLLPLGQEEALGELFSVYRELPIADFKNVAQGTQPVTVRRAVVGQDTFVYLVNDSPWPATVAMDLDLPRGCQMAKLGRSLGVGPLVPAGRTSNWTIAMRPYDMVGVRFSSPAASIVHTHVQLPDGVPVALDRRIQDLVARARALGTLPPLSAPENPGFELPSPGGRIVGWSAAVKDGGAVTIDRNTKQHGNQSVHLISRGSFVSLTSNPVVPPKTGRLLISASLRVSEVAEAPRVRLAVRARHEGSEFTRFGIIGGSQTAASPLGPQWARYDFPLDDLPTEGVSDLRVSFELLGAGEVWLDDVQLYDLAFQPNERIELTKIITLAYSRLKAGEVGDCARLLDGYWPQFLVANVPLTQTPIAVAARAARPNPPPPPEPERQGPLNRIRGYMPRFLRL